MADHGFKVSRSLNLNPQSGAPTNPVAGDVYYDSTIGSFVYYTGTAWANLDSIGSVASAASLTSSAFTPAVVQNSIVRLTGSTTSTLHGMSASFTAKRVAIYNNSTATLTINHQSASEATANNRIITPNATNMTLIAGEIAQFMYDSTQSRWLLVSVGSGAGAYAAATTTTNGTVTLNAAAVTAGSPEVAVTDSSERVVAQGVTRGSFAAGDLAVGTGANDSSVTISKSGATTTVAGALAVNGTVTLSERVSGAKLAGHFTNANTNKTHINFTAASGGNDAGAIIHESSGQAGDVDKAVLHLIPSDNANGDDFVAIHGTGQAESTWTKFFVNGDASIPGTLGVTGAATLSSTLGVTGATTLSSTLGVTGAATLSSTLGVTGAATLSSTLGVTGATTLSSTLGVTGAVTLNSTLNVAGATTITDANCQGDTTLQGHAILASASKDYKFASARTFSIINGAHGLRNHPSGNVVMDWANTQSDTMMGWKFDNASISGNNHSRQYIEGVIHGIPTDAIVTGIDILVEHTDTDSRDVNITVLNRTLNYAANTTGYTDATPLNNVALSIAAANKTRRWSSYSTGFPFTVANGPLTVRFSVNSPLNATAGNAVYVYAVRVIYTMDKLTYGK